MADKTMGRPTIYPGAKVHAVHGSLTKVGGELFEKARRRLAKVAKLDVGKVSDGATVEYLARGEEAPARNGK